MTQLGGRILTAIVLAAGGAMVAHAKQNIRNDAYHSHQFVIAKREVVKAIPAHSAKNSVDTSKTRQD